MSPAAAAGAGLVLTGAGATLAAVALLWGRRSHRTADRSFDAALRLAHTEPCGQFVDSSQTAACARCGFWRVAHYSPAPEIGGRT